VFSLAITPRLNMRIGPWATLLPGLALMGAGLVVFALSPVHASYLSNLLPVMVLIGIGAGLSFPSLMTIAMSGATPADAGLASGLVNVSMQVGGALGLAVLATLSSSRVNQLQGQGSSRADALTSGLHLALSVGAGLLAAAIVITATVLRPGISGAEAAVAPDGLDPAEAEPAYAQAAGARAGPARGADHEPALADSGPCAPWPSSMRPTPDPACSPRRRRPGAWRSTGG
jgi:MFS family permease